MAGKWRASTASIRPLRCCDEPASNRWRPKRNWWEASAEIIPFDNDVFDTVVTTWTLCTIPQVMTALRDMRRVLRPDGRLLFVEHGLAPDRAVAWWQHRLTPCWKCVSGGCHLNRKIDDLIEAAGFHIEQLDTGYMQRYNPFAFIYEGVARLAN
jgi:ubiquinone/menaquinone biosynthesis C-methylase UbiE